MPDRGKAVDGLEMLRFFNQRAGRELWADKPHDIQETDIANADAIFADTIALLKAQEPRIMTLEEVKAIPYDADIWIETEYYVGKITIFAATINTKGLRGVMVYGSHKTYDYEAYNKLWRCWTARPTDEQRKTVK